MSPSDNVYSVFTDFSILPQILAAAEITLMALPLLSAMVSWSTCTCLFLQTGVKGWGGGYSSTAEQLLGTCQILGSIPSTDSHKGSATKVKFSAICFPPVCSVIFLPMHMCEARKQSFLLDL